MQQGEGGRFAGAGRADQRDSLAGQRDELMSTAAALAAIGKRNILELDQPVEPAGIDRVGPVAHRRHGIPDLKNSRSRGASDTTLLMKLTVCSSRLMMRAAKFMNVTISPTVA